MHLTPAEAHELIRNDPSLRLIDVRPPSEYQTIHVQGAELLPFTQLDPQAVAAQVEADQRVVVFCRKGVRAQQAAEKLEAAGCRNVAVVAGGMEAWEQAGLPVVRGAATMSLERQVRIGAGSLVVLGILLGWLVHPALYLLAAFVGAGLVFAGVTDTCGMAMVLARMPWNQARTGREKVSTGQTPSGAHT